MSKLNKNKIISLFFVSLAIILIILSFQKSQTENQNIESQNEIIEINSENISDDVIYDNSIKTNESKTLEKTDYSFIGNLNFNLEINSKKITGYFSEGDTLYDSLDKMKKAGILSFEEKSFSGLGAYIYSIEGISEDKKNGKYWIYYINDEKANVGVSNYLLKEGDEIRWHLENNTD